MAFYIDQDARLAMVESAATDFIMEDVSTLHSQSPIHEVPAMIVRSRETLSTEQQMIEFFFTARRLHFRLQFGPETLAAMLIVIRLWQRLT